MDRWTFEIATAGDIYVWQDTARRSRLRHAVLLDQLGLAPIDLLYLLDDAASGRAGCARRSDRAREMENRDRAPEPHIRPGVLEIDLSAQGQGGCVRSQSCCRWSTKSRKLLTHRAPAHAARSGRAESILHQRRRGCSDRRYQSSFSAARARAMATWRPAAGDDGDRCCTGF